MVGGVYQGFGLSSGRGSVPSGVSREVHRGVTIWSGECTTRGVKGGVPGGYISRGVKGGAPEGHRLLGGVFRPQGSQGRYIGTVTIWSEKCVLMGVKGNTQGWGHHLIGGV